MQRQGAWACEAYTVSASSQLVETMNVLELKDGVGQVQTWLRIDSNQSLFPWHI